MNALPSWYDPDDERTARAAWSRLTEPVDAPADAFVRRVGAAEALGHVLRGGGAGLAVAARWRSRLPDLDPREDLRELASVGGRLVVPGDDEWPHRLDDLEVPPFCLWVRGPLRLNTACERAAAIVGARASTEYGVRVAALFATRCAELGITVVSGAAYGIDGAAHVGLSSAAAPRSRSSRRVSTGPTRGGTPRCWTGSPPRGWSSARCHPDRRRRGAASSSATG